MNHKGCRNRESKDMLNRDQILGVIDVTIQKVEVKEWGGEIFIRSMSAADRESLAQSISGEGNKNTMARAVALCVCDEQGKRLFTNNDASALGDKSASAMDRVFKAIVKLNGMGEEAGETARKN